MTKSRDIFGCPNWGAVRGKGAPGIYWAEAKDTVKHPTAHRAAPLPPTILPLPHTTKNYLLQNVSSAEVEKDWDKIFNSLGSKQGSEAEQLLLPLTDDFGLWLPTPPLALSLTLF